MIKLVSELPDDLLEWRNDPSVLLNSRISKPISNEEHQNWLHQTDTTFQKFGIEEIETGLLTGYCGLRADPSWVSAEFSIILGPGFRNRGIGKAALRSLCRYGFDNLNLHSIWGECLEGNAALKTFLSIGFKPDGILRERYLKNGRFVNSTIVSLLRDELC